MGQNPWNIFYVLQTNSIFFQLYEKLHYLYISKSQKNMKEKEERDTTQIYKAWQSGIPYWN